MSCLLRWDKILLYSSPEGNYSVTQSNKNIVREYYKSGTDESNTTNPNPSITHPRTYNTLKLTHKIKLLSKFSLNSLSQCCVLVSGVKCHQLHCNDVDLRADAVVMTPIGLAHPQLQNTLQSQQAQQQVQQAMVSKAVSVVSMDVMEQKQWWHLEEVKRTFVLPWWAAAFCSVPLRTFFFLSTMINAVACVQQK